MSSQSTKARPTAPERLDILQELKVPDGLSDRLSNQIKFGNKNIQDYSQNRQRDLRRVARTGALKLFEHIHPDAAGVLKLVCDGEKENQPQLANQVVGQSILVQGNKSSYSKASDSGERVRLLSVLSPQFKRKEMSEILQAKISPYNFHLAKERSVHFYQKYYERNTCMLFFLILPLKVYWIVMGTS